MRIPFIKLILVLIGLCICFELLMRALNTCAFCHPIGHVSAVVLLVLMAVVNYRFLGSVFPDHKPFRLTVAILLAIFITLGLSVVDFSLALAGITVFGEII